jgi:hypothetical protein
VAWLQVVEDIVQWYRQIPPLLKKTEELLEGSSSGRSQGDDCIILVVSCTHKVTMSFKNRFPS